MDQSFLPISTSDDQHLPPPPMVQAYLLDDDDHVPNQRGSDKPHQNSKYQLPPIMAQAQPADDSNRCTFRTVSLEYAQPDGTIMVHTEKLVVFPDGSTRVVESRDDVKQQQLPAGEPPHQHNEQQQLPVPHKPTGSTAKAAAAAALPIRVQTTAVPITTTMWSHCMQEPPTALPARIRTDAVPRGYGHTIPVHNATNHGHYTARSQGTFAVPSGSGQPIVSAALPVRVQTAAVPRWGHENHTPTPTSMANNNAANYHSYGHLPTRLPGYIVPSSTRPTPSAPPGAS
jgi:hypothetical protein